MSRCVRCLAETPPESFFENDYLCDICAALREEFPLASTPEPDMMENIKKLNEHARSVTGIVDLPRAQDDPQITAYDRGVVAHALLPAGVLRAVPVDLSADPLFPGATVGRDGNCTATMFRCPKCGTKTVLGERLVTPEPDEGEERPLVSTTDAQVAAYGRAGEFRRTLVKMQNGLFRGAWDKDAGGVPEPDEGGES